MDTDMIIEAILIKESSSTESDSDSTENQNANGPSLSNPPNVPSATIDKIGSQDNANPVFHCNCPTNPTVNDSILGARSSIGAGRQVHNEPPGLRDFTWDFQPVLTQNSVPTEKKSDESAAQKESSCCLHQNPAPCLYCAMRLQDGDLRALCRRDPENESDSCIECAYAGRTCTWGGFKPREQGALLVEARSCSIKTVAEHGLSSASGKMALYAMQCAAAEYLAAFWRDGNICDLIGVQCLYNSSRAKRQRMVTRKKTTRKRNQKGSSNKACKEMDKDIEISSYLNQGYGLAMGHLMILREIMRCNRTMAERLEKNSEILRAVLSS